MGLLEPRRREVREVAAVRLPQAALDRLQESLGEEVRLVDITRSTPDAVLVVCPPCSPQTIGALSRQFPPELPPTSWPNRSSTSPPC